jgi:RNA polymerase-binding transcription factor DksA
MSGKKAKNSKAKAAKKPAAPSKAKTKEKQSPAKKAPAKPAAKKKVPAPAKKPSAASSAKAPKASGKTPANTPPPAPAVRPGPRFPIKTPSRPSMTVPGPKHAPGEKPKPLSAKFLEKQRKNLLELRDHVLDQMQGVAQDSLKSNDNAPSSAFGMHQADAGSDAYEKDFALSLLSQEQDALYEIEEALKRIELGTYGICEMSGAPIPIERLEAIPFARYTVQCQEQMERENRAKNRWDTSPQFMDSAENFFEEEDDTEEDSQKLKD